MTATEITGRVLRGEEVAISYEQLPAVREIYKELTAKNIIHYYSKSGGQTMVYAEDWKKLALRYCTLTNTTATKHATNTTATKHANNTTATKHANNTTAT